MKPPTTMSTPARDEVAIFRTFVATLENENVSPEQGLQVLDGFQVTAEMRAKQDLMREWQYWTEAARAAAALNQNRAAPLGTERLSEVFARYFLATDGPVNPRYSLCIALMKFTTHQVRHAFGRINGLPYPAADGSRAYGTPQPALEAAFTGQSQLERDVDELWRQFVEDTAERVGFDLAGALS